MKPTLTNLNDVLLGLLGAGAQVIGVVASWQEHLEWGMRVASLLVGIAVGVVTIINLRRRSK